MRTHFPNEKKFLFKFLEKKLSQLKIQALLFTNQSFSKEVGHSEQNVKTDGLTKRTIINIDYEETM